MKFQPPNDRMAGRGTLIASALTLALSFGSASAATFVWDGGAGTNDLGAANNWNPNGSPSGSTSDILRWDGSVAGDLALAYTQLNPALNTAAGVSINVTAGQTSALQIDGGANPIRLNSSGITIEYSAGEVSLGDGSGTSHFTVPNGTISMVNNTYTSATINSDVVFSTVAAGITTFAFSGSANWHVNTDLNSTNNGNANRLTFTGIFGSLFLNAANTFSGLVTIGANGTQSILLATATGALGTGNVHINGNGGGNRLDLQGNITIANPINANGKGNTPHQSPAIFNRSGNNILSNTLTVNTGGTYSAIRSESGTLTFTAATSITSAATGFRAIQFTGDGNIIINGAITNGNSSGLTIEKLSSGLLTISGNCTYTGATTISAGRFLVNGSLGNTAVSVTSGGRLGGDGSIAGMVTVSGGYLQPGNGLGSLATGALTMISGSRFEHEMMNGSATGADLLAVNGPLSLTDVGFGLPYDVLADPSWVWGDKITFISYKFSGVELTSGFSGFFFTDDTIIGSGTNEWLFDYNDTVPGNNFAADAIAAGQNRFVTLTFIPEPGAALLGGFGLLGGLRRRRK